MDENLKDGRIKRWIKKHPDTAVLIAQAGVVAGSVLAAYGLYKATVPGTELKEAAEKAKDYIRALERENVALYNWIDAQVDAGVEFQKVEPDLIIKKFATGPLRIVSFE